MGQWIDGERDGPWLPPSLPGSERPVGVFLCLVAPHACINARGQTVSKRKFMGQKVRTLDDLRPQVEAYSEAVADHHTDQTVASLPTRLEALWAEGVPLDSSGYVLSS